MKAKPPKTKKIDGKTYKLAEKRLFIDRKIANLNAKHYRKKGYSVRVIIWEHPNYLGSYLIYKRWK